MKLKNTLKSYTQKNGTIWEWEETSELIKQLNQISKNENEKK